MKHQHRATPEQWQAIEANGHLPTRSTIRELLCRIEALEATQHAYVDLSPLSDAEREQIRKQLASPGRFEVLEVAHPPQRNHPEIPDGSLVERVAEALRLAPRRPDYAARAAIREIAAWLREEKGYGPGWAIRLEQEAE